MAPLQSWPRLVQIMAEAPLAGRGIVVTRPREQAAALKTLIEDAGGRAFVFPTLEIAPLPDARSALATLDRLEAFDLAVFASANAVRMAFRLLHERRPGRNWPSALPAAGVGKGTAQALGTAGVDRVMPPSETSDSEGLLSLSVFNEVRGKRVLIFRGQGGRPLLGDTLRQRGADVSYVECYQRLLPPSDPAALLERWRQSEIDAVTVSSSEGLSNLLRLIGDAGAANLRGTPLFVPHQRVADRARTLGLDRVCVAGPVDAEMVRALVAYFSGAK